jgi:hypothetical protein
MRRGSLLEEEFNEYALKIHRFQRAHNVPYANFCRHMNAPEMLTSWRSIPAAPLSAFREFALCVFPASRAVKTFRTSGTTGEGFGSHHFRSLRLYEHSITRCWDLLELPRLPQIILAPSPARAPHSSLNHMMGTLRQRAPGEAQCYGLDENGRLDAKLLARHIQRHVDDRTPVLMLGTALAYLHFFEEMKSTGAKWLLPPGSSALETGGYKGSRRALEKSQLYALFQNLLGINADDVINEYSMTELSSQFYSRGVGNVHIGPPWTRALVINPETEHEAEEGGTGALRIFDLANLGSVIAIQTRDLAIRRGENFELIGRDPVALARGCSRAADESLSQQA